MTYAISRNRIISQVSFGPKHGMGHKSKKGFSQISWTNNDCWWNFMCVSHSIDTMTNSDPPSIDRTIATEWQTDTFTFQLRTIIKLSSLTNYICCICASNIGYREYVSPRNCVQPPATICFLLVSNLSHYIFIKISYISNFWHKLRKREEVGAKCLFPICMHTIHCRYTRVVIKNRRSFSINLFQRLSYYVLVGLLTVTLSRKMNLKKTLLFKHFRIEQRTDTYHMHGI